MTRTFQSLLLVLLTASTVAAGTISIRSSIQAERRGGDLLLAVELGNAGDQAAHQVQALLEVAGDRFAGPVHQQIAPEATRTERWQIPLSGKAPGRHPILLSVHYADANGYPFTALASAIFTIDHDVVSQLSARFLTPSLNLVAGAATSLELVNLSRQPLQLNLRLIGPRELRLRPERARQQLGPQQRAEVNVRLENLSALTGSRYPIFAVVEYSRQSHYTTIAQGWVEIGERRSLLPLLRYALYGVLLLLAAVISWRARRSRPGPGC